MPVKFKSDYIPKVDILSISKKSLFYSVFFVIQTGHLSKTCLDRVFWFYNKSPTSNRATMLTTFIMGLIAGPAVSL